MRVSISLKQIVAFVVAALFAACATAQTPFYSGKRLTILINFGVGGGPDIEGRLFARHLAKHLKGSPTIVVQNMDGAGGLVAPKFLGEVGAKDGSIAGLFTGAAWRYANDPAQFKVDFRTYEFVAYQPGTTVYFARSDTPPGLKQAADIVKTKNLVVGGLAADNSKDLLTRLGLDLLGVPYKYVTGYKNSAAARLALQQKELTLFAETAPAYRTVVTENLVKPGIVIPIWHDPTVKEGGYEASKQVEGLNIPAFPDLYRQVKGTAASGPMWDAYRTIARLNGTMLRIVAFPPGVPREAIEALRAGINDVNQDKAYAEEALKTVGYLPLYETGTDVKPQVLSGLNVDPAVLKFISGYIRDIKK